MLAQAIADGRPARLTPTTILELQRTVGNAGVTRLLVARCPDGEVPPEGCAHCGQPAVQRRAVHATDIQRQAGARPTIQFGSQGPAVSELQSRLIDAGASIEVDGAFGGKTLSAVKAAQAAAGLPADGIVGPRTWGAMEAGVQLPGGGTPPRGYGALLERVGVAIGALRGGGPASTVAPPPSVSIGSTKAATGSAPATDRAPVQRQDDEEEGASLWDQASEAAGGAWDQATEATGNAWEAGSTAAGDAWEGGSEAAGDAWEGGSEAAGGAVESVADAGEQLWEGASQVVESYTHEIAGIPGAIRERFGSEIAALEQVIADLGRGFQLSDDEIDAMTEVVTGLMNGLELDVGPLDESKCTPATQAVAFSQPSFKVSFDGLNDLNKKVTGKMGGHAGHVKLDAMPAMKVTCWDGTGPSRTVGAARITAQGAASFPTPADPDETNWKTQSTQRDREITGIRDYFSIIKTHEDTHVRIYMDAFLGAADELKGLTESEASTRWKFIVCQAFGSQDSLDKAEGCVEVAHGMDASKAGASVCGLTPDATKSCPK